MARPLFVVVVALVGCAKPTPHPEPVVGSSPPDVEPEQKPPPIARGDDRPRERRTEAAATVANIAAHIKAYFVELSAFPPDAAPLPGVDGKACAVSGPENPGKFAPEPAKFAADKGWSAIGFDVMGPSLFTYHWSSTGNLGTILAVGDIDCDGTLVTYRLTLENKNGNLAETTYDPTPD